MAKASPMIRSFNAGEFSELMSGRVDLDRYPSSLHSFENYIAAPQGPAIGRSGTAFVGPNSNNSEKSTLIPFVFSNEQAVVLEFSGDRIRFFDESGIQTYSDLQATVVSASGDPVRLQAAINANVGDQVVLSGFPSNYNLNGEIVNVTAVSGNEYTLDVNFPAQPIVNGRVARVYHVSCTYTEAQRETLRELQSVDVMYLLSDSTRPRKLSRFGARDWRLENVQFVDGPFLPVSERSNPVTPTGTGNAIPSMTSNTLPAGTAGGGGVASGHSYFHAFDENEDTYWESNVNQTGTLQYTPATPFVCDGYTIYSARDNANVNYIDKDYAPSSFTFEGYDGSDWVVLDAQEDYVLYDGNKSVFFTLDNETAYQDYRLVITKVRRNGPLPPRVRRLVMRDRAGAMFDLNAANTNGVNNDTGFQSTDVGRLIRLKGTDTAWRAAEVTAVAGTSQVTVKLLGEPLLNVKPITQWRLGYWSDTTGWPATGDFFEDRLWLAAGEEYPDLFAGSVTGAYETFSQTDTFGVVLDDSAVVRRLNSRRLSRIRWLSSDVRGLMIGTGSEEYTLSSPNDEALTARNIRARPATRRGSANVEPVRVDNQVLYVQRSGRSIREFAFVFEADGYKSPSMTQLASHLGAHPFKELAYATEPHSIVWARRSDGTLVGLTYNRDENVIGWHRHDLSGATVESIAVIPQQDQLQDALWLAVKRRVNGVDKRYIERLTRFWDFDTELSDAHYVDSGLRYLGAATDTVYGLQHLEGEEVYGLADAKPVGPFTVANGSVTLPFEAENIVMGIGFDAVGVLPRLENGARDGTAQGKTKRIHGLSISLWRSFNGEIGVYNEQEEDYVYEPLEYPGDGAVFEDIELFTGVIGPVNPAPGYDFDARIAFRRPKSSPLPFNPVAIMPQLHTQDR